MKDKKEIVRLQKEFIEEQKNEAKNFIDKIDKSEIETILLSGSVARGDFFPGKFGGMIDLIVMRKKESRVTAEDIFGPNQEPDIPFHCVKSGACWFEILFTDFISADDFAKFEEARKYSVLEAEILYDANGSYEKVLVKLKEQKSRSISNYRKREELFRKTILDFVDCKIL